MAQASQQQASRNRILRKLPRDEFDRLVSAGETIRLERGATVIKPGKPLTHVHFPLSGRI